MGWPPWGVSLAISPAQFSVDFEVLAALQPMRARLTWGCQPRQRRTPAISVCWAILAVALVTSACSAVLGPSSPSVAPISGVDPLRPSMPTDIADVSPTPGVPIANPADFKSMPWTLAAISDDRREITVVFIAGDGDCLVRAGYHITVDGTTLVLGEYSRVTSVRVCGAKTDYGVETVPLPLDLDASVQLVHAPTSEMSPRNICQTCTTGCRRWEGRLNPPGR